jgi:proteic killer suppression protein
MILSWADRETETIWSGRFSKLLPHDIQRVAKRKLVQIHSAKVLEDLRVPPGNRLEKLSGDRTGYWSIRINDQWRVCFRWENGNAFEVGVVDYH